MSDTRCPSVVLRDLDGTFPTQLDCNESPAGCNFVFVTNNFRHAMSCVCAQNGMSIEASMRLVVESTQQCTYPVVCTGPLSDPMFGGERNF